MNTLADLAVLRQNAKARSMLAMVMGLLVASCATSEPTRDRTETVTQARTIKTAPAVTPQTVAAPPVILAPPIVRLPTTAPTNEAPLPQLKAMYEAKLRELDRTRDKSIADAPAQYRLYLQNLEKQFVEKGDLKGVLAVQNESNRFAKAAAVTTNDLVSAPEALLVAQRLMIGAPDSAERGRLKGRDDLNRAYCAALERLVTSLTQANRIPEAQAARDEADRICPFVPPAPVVTNAPPIVRRNPPPLPMPQPPEPVAPVLPAGLKNGLIAFYPFNGTGEDISANRHDADVQGASPTTNRFGAIASALYFDGVDDVVSVSADISPDRLTICMWTKFPSDEVTGQLIRRMATSRTGFGIVPDRGKVAFMVFTRGGKSVEHLLPDLDGDRWHHLAMTFGSNEFRVFVDGIQVRSTRISQSVQIDYGDRSIRRLCIGGLGQSFNQRGSIDNVGIWSRDLNIAEIRQAMAVR